MDGIITEIMRFSLKDGPGIRTTVFLKGCNMACKWCQNPETLSMRPQLMRYPQKCIGCGECVRSCPNGALTVKPASGDKSGGGSGAGGNGGGTIVYDAGKCVSCGACANNCFSGALVISGKKMSVGEVMAEVIQDDDYYRNSGGGLTVGGGEAACQPEFTLELLKAAKDAGIQTAIETNMYADWSVYEKMLPYLDLVMLDIKLSGDAAHAKWTGVGNARVLDNARKISNLKPVIVRTPIIPGVTDSAEEIGRIAEIVKGLRNVSGYELLLYNPLGESKYDALGETHEFKGARPQGPELAGELTEAAKAAGVPVKIG